MTRKDFELIASVLRGLRLNTGTDDDNLTYNEVLTQVSAALAQALRGTNANFDRSRFLRACGVE